VAEVGIVALKHGLTYVKVPVVLVVTVDQCVSSDVFASTPIEYTPASESTSELANVIVFPDTVIREVLGPVTTNLYSIVHVRPLVVLELKV
jgi:D-aminopeptidase